MGINAETFELGNMYFNRTLEDWIAFDINNRTKHDLTISSGYALLAAQNTKKVVERKSFEDKKFFRTYKTKEWHR